MKRFFWAGALLLAWACQASWAQTQAHSPSQPTPGRALATQKRDFNLDDFIAAGHRVTNSAETEPTGNAAEKCTTTLADAKTKLKMHELDDDAAFRAIHAAYYPDISKEEFARRICYTIPQPPKPKELGAIDRWRYESCQSDAAKAPTSQGVNAGLRVCREKFGQ
jgi:hypothetical protein